MMNLLRLFSLLFILINCTNEKTPVEAGQDIAISTGDPHPVSADPDKFKLIEPIESNELIRILSTKGFTEKEKTRLHEKIVPKMRETIKSDCFKKFILASDMIQTNGKDNIQVYTDLTSEVIGINLIMYHSYSSTVGYTFAESDKIWMNRKFHRKFNECGAASNLGHEAIAHKKGYGHSKRATSRRLRSVPYILNAGFKSCCLTNEPVYTCKRSWRSLWLCR